MSSITRCMFGLPQQVWIQISTSSSPSTSRLKASTMNFTCSWSLPKVLAMKCRVGSSICISRQPASRSARSSLFMASAMSQTTSRLSRYFGVWMSRKRAITCEQQVPKRTGFSVLPWVMRQIFG